MQPRQYIGRYAPSPTGELHLGNLRTALLAWLHARLQNGRFLLRIEDLDTPRVVSGSAEQILQDLQWMGLDWDGQVVYQSDRLEAYQGALDVLDSQTRTYPCFCSRKDIQQAASAPHSREGVYPETCVNLSNTAQQAKAREKAPAIRVRVNRDLKKECGDFVIKRADGLFAYQLAVVVDDQAQGVNTVIRGADLKSCTARQLFLAQCLVPDSKPIRYLHAPLLLGDDGKRMSKRDGSQSIAQWRETGKGAESLIAFLAASLGLTDAPAITARELLSCLTVAELEECFE